MSDTAKTIVGFLSRDRSTGTDLSKQALESLWGQKLEMVPGVVLNKTSIFSAQRTYVRVSVAAVQHHDQEAS